MSTIVVELEDMFRKCAVEVERERKVFCCGCKHCNGGGGGCSVKSRDGIKEDQRGNQELQAAIQEAEEICMYS